MAFYSDAQLDFNNVADNYGEIFRIKYYAISGGITDYDDSYKIQVSGGNIWTSGLMFPLTNSSKGSSEAVLMEEGKIVYDDMMLYLKGTVNLSGEAIKIGAGSPVTQEYFILKAGIDDHAIQGNNVYRKAYVRVLNNGSFINEV